MNKFIFVVLFLILGICPARCLEYNYESTLKLPVKLTILEPIDSEKNIYEGQIVKFKSIKNVVYDGKVVIRRGEIIPAKVKLIISSGMNGIPASIVFGDFKIKGISQSQITYSYEIFGQDRSLWVFPLKWALTPLPPAGSLTNFIKGGHARLSTNKVITIYYHPEWI